MPLCKCNIFGWRRLYGNIFIVVFVKTSRHLKNKLSLQTQVICEEGDLFFYRNSACVVIHLLLLRMSLNEDISV
jgi:hypothetical protein